MKWESPFSFERNSDELMKISVREDDDEDLKPVNKEEDDMNANPYSQYKMPTF